MSRTKISGCVFGVLVLLSATPAVLKAQQESSSTPAKDAPPKPGAISPALLLDGEIVREEGPASTQTPGPPDPYAGSIKDVNSGLPLLSSMSPLRWGNFSIFTVEFIGIHDSLSGANNSPIGGSTPVDLFFLRTGVMFDRPLFKNKSRVALQYLPQMAISNGQFHANGASNNNLSLGTELELAPRLKLTVADNFVQVHQNSLIPENYFAVNHQLGAFAQNSFFSTNGSFISNSSNLILKYDLSPRTSVSFSPSFNYMRSVNNSSSFAAKGQIYTGTLVLAHALTPRRTVGIDGSYQYVKESIQTAPENAAYTTLGGFYSEQLAQTFWLTGKFGATSQKYSGAAQNGGWGLSADLSVTKAISPRVNSALAYSRGTVLSNYVTRQRSDRVDVLLNVMLSSRIFWSNGVGYQRELAGLTPTSGKYATTGATYRFTKDINAFCTFSFAFQDAHTQQLISGDRKTLAYGIRWSPPRLLSR